MGLRETLKKNAAEFYSSAMLVYGKGDTTSAFILGFKALLAIADYHLLVSGIGVPKDHTERFALLRKSSPELYNVVDRMFGFYRQSYSATVGKAVCDEVLLYAKSFAKKYGIEKIG
jgi:hypothetical protein